MTLERQRTWEGKGGRRGPLARVALIALASALVGATAGTAESQGDFVRLVADAKGARGDAEIEERAAELARLPGALDSYFAIVADGSLPGPPGSRATPLTSAQSRLLAETAKRFAAEGVVTHVETALAGGPDARWRHVALQLLGLHARSDDLPLLSRVVLEGSRPTDSLVDDFQEAVTAVLRRWGVQPQVLNWVADRAESVALAVVRAVGQADDPDGLLWLADHLDDADLGMAALQEIGRLAPLGTGEIARETARQLGEVLDAHDEARRKQAIRALGALREPASIPVLARVLGDGASDTERKMAHRALRAITGLTLPATSTAWTSWYAAEQRWLEQAAEATLERLASDDEAEVVAAVRELSEHGLYRDRIALDLAPLLADHPSPAVRGQVCLALGRLGSRVAVPELTRACEDEDPQVQRHARSALQAIGEPATSSS